VTAAANRATKLRRKMTVRMALSFAVAMKLHLLARWRVSKVGLAISLSGQTLTGVFYIYKSYLFICLFLNCI